MRPIADGEENESFKEITVTAPLTPDSIRSPRKQMFTDLPTPSYHQTNFHIGPGPGQAASLAPGLTVDRTPGTSTQKMRHSAYEPNFHPPQQGGHGGHGGQANHLHAPQYTSNTSHTQQEQHHKGPRYPSYHPPTVHDTGFIPLQPSYEAPLMHQQQTAQQGQGQFQQHLQQQQQQQQSQPRHQGQAYQPPYPQPMHQHPPQHFQNLQQYQQQQQQRQLLPSDNTNFGSLNGALAAQ